MAQLVEIMREQEAARGGPFARELYRGGLARRLFDDGELDAAATRIRARLPELQRGTTHISVVDGHGNAASLTASTGSGSGVIVPGTGIQLNNMLGEFDLAVDRRHLAAGPALHERDGAVARAPRRPAAARGRQRRLAAAARRDHAGDRQRRRATGSACEEAIERPRVHLETPDVHVEGGNDPAELDRLEAFGYELARWQSRNLFFGGAAGVELLEDGTLAAAGDPRRGGHGVVVV